MQDMVGTSNESTRKAWLKKTLAAIPPGKRLLDAGAGELANKAYCEHLDYLSQDLCQYEGRGDERGLQTGGWDTKEIDIVCDVTDVPEDDASFDVILCSEVLEHLPDPQKALAEFHRLLKPDGKLVLTAPFCSLTHFAPYHYCSGFNRYFYEHHLEKLGFAVDEVTANGNYFEYLAQEIRRIPSMAEKYGAGELPFLGRCAVKILLKILERFSARDTASDEVLCYGYQVVARKK